MQHAIEIKGNAMKTTALCFVLFVSTQSLAAEVPSGAGTSCREMVAQVRPGLEEGEEAALYMESADKAYRDCRGAQHPIEIRAKVLFKYGIASASRGREQTAVEALREAVSLFDRSDGDNTELLIEILDYTSFMETQVGMRTDAISHSKRAADARVKKYGPDSGEAADGLTNLAVRYATFKEYEKAEALLRDAIQIAQRACGPECDALVHAYAGMEVLFTEQGNSAEAKRYAELAVEAVPSRRSKHKN